MKGFADSRRYSTNGVQTLSSCIHLNPWSQRVFVNSTCEPCLIRRCDLNFNGVHGPASSRRNGNHDAKQSIQRPRFSSFLLTKNIHFRHYASFESSGTGQWNIHITIFRMSTIVYFGQNKRTLIIFLYRVYRFFLYPIQGDRRNTNEPCE